MPRKRPLPRGITETTTGWRISTRSNGKLFQRRYRRSRYTIEDVEDALRHAQRAQPAGKSEAPITGLAADVASYLTDYFTGRPGYEERARHLKLWTEALGADTPRRSLTRDEVARVLNGWRGSGLAPDTCNKRRSALLALFHALDGRGGSNPVREIPKFRVADPLPRGVAYDLIEKALKQLPVSKTEARLRLMAYTGLRQGQIMKLTPDHWDHKQHMLTVPGTAKGRGTRAYVIPLSVHAQAALKTFDSREAWGTFTYAPAARLWRQAWYAAVTKQKRTPLLKVPKAFVAPVPYDLRHSFGTRVYQQSGDIHAARKLLGHSSLKMTERYTLAAVPGQQLAAIRAFEVGLKLPVKVATTRK